MDLGLKGQVILITGGSKGLGLACARLFIAEGARVAIASRSHENLEKARAQLGQVETFAADLCQPRPAAEMVDAVERRVGPVDGLVNSAGAARRVGAEDLSPETWRAAMDAKYFSYINVIDPLIKRMAARGDGVIINIIGNGGKIASPIHLAGGAANAALMLATAGLANAYAAKGVRVVGLNPGLTNTSRVSEGLKADAKREGISEDEALARAKKKLPLGRLAEPGEIADIAVFAASVRGRFLTGANISCDGVSTATVV